MASLTNRCTIGLGVGLLACATRPQHLGDAAAVVDLGRFADANAGISKLAAVLVAGEDTPPHMLRCAT